jgi:hypothetical protein
MPHIIIEGKKINFELIYSYFIKTEERINIYIIIFEDSFINQSKDLIITIDNIIIGFFSKIYNKV